MWVLSFQINSKIFLAMVSDIIVKDVRWFGTDNEEMSLVICGALWDAEVQDDR